MSQPSIMYKGAPPTLPRPRPFHQHLVLEILHLKDMQRPRPTHWQVSELTSWPRSPQRKARRALRPHQAPRLRSDKNINPVLVFKTCLSLLFKAQKPKGPSCKRAGFICEPKAGLPLTNPPPASPSLLKSSQFATSQQRGLCRRSAPHSTPAGLGYV